jgi:DNA-binding MarR family transcriptional regulator
VSRILPPTPALSRAELIDKLSEYTLYLMWALKQEALRIYEPYGLRPLQGFVIELIARGVMHPKALADMLDVAPPAVSALLAELEQRGLVTREPDPDDGRRVRLGLSEVGEALRREVKKRWHQDSNRLLKHLSDDDLAKLIAIYQKMLEGA